MKEIRVAAFTQEGGNLCQGFVQNFLKQGYHCEGYLSKEYLKGNNLLNEFGLSLNAWMERQMVQADALVLICSFDFAAYAAAPFLKRKGACPAIIVVDQENHLALCLSHGTKGFGTDLLKQINQFDLGIAAKDGFTPLFQPRTWANAHDCVILDKDIEERVSAALLDGESVSFDSQLPVASELPQGLIESKNGKMGIVLSYQNELEEKNSYENTLRIYPKCLVLGLCCRKGVDTLVLERQILAVLHRENISLHCIAGVYSIDSRKEEPAIMAFVKKYSLPFSTFSGDELLDLPGEFDSCEFTQPVDGVENVCERAAVLGSNGGEMLVKKAAGNGVTVSVVKTNWKADFQEEIIR